ncbi:unnamed protein product [Phytophthora fragariaefolia]|uniref:Unnamed protein product n=1 Tax=Phytophthora fragariaefolia TaxID=1490495 RepID=A0A9W6U9Z7_9STRA|nr:unnamed protein product [Phytophthora fragariaefolia]
MRSQAQASQEHVRASSYPERRRSSVATAVYQPVTSNIYRLVVPPIVKAAVGEYDDSGNELDPFVAGGSSFQDILEKKTMGAIYLSCGKADSQNGWCLGYRACNYFLLDQIRGVSILADVGSRWLIKSLVVFSSLVEIS